MIMKNARDWHKRFLGHYTGRLFITQQSDLPDVSRLMGPLQVNLPVLESFWDQVQSLRYASLFAN